MILHQNHFIKNANKALEATPYRTSLSYDVRLRKWNPRLGYTGDEVVLGFPDGEILEGSIPNPKMKLVQAWIEIHKEELLANWELAINGQELFKIEPLK